MNNNSYAGREYLDKLQKRSINIDVILIGQYSELDSIEEERSGGLWKPKPLSSLKESFDFYKFSSLKSKKLISFLKDKNYYLCIQGGTGILDQELISCFSIGILNFHPGDLPLYRGSSAPEWQRWENKPIVSTCHLIDEGIDSGPIYNKKILNVKEDSYHSFRASIYPETAIFVADTIELISDKINQNIEIKFNAQDQSQAKYRRYIGEDKISIIKKSFS